MCQNTWIQRVFIDCFDCELWTGGVVASSSDIQRGNNDRIHLSKEQAIFVVLLIESDVMNTRTIGNQMGRFLFGVGEQRCRFTSCQWDGDERHVSMRRAQCKNSSRVRQWQPGHGWYRVMRWSIRHGWIHFGVVQSIGHGRRMARLLRAIGSWWDRRFSGIRLK